MKTGKNKGLLQPTEFNLTDYESKYNSFRWSSVDKEIDWDSDSQVNIAYSSIDRHVRSGKGDRVALIFYEENKKTTYTFEDLENLSNKLANALKKMGISRGERVVLFLPTIPEFYISLLGVIKAGAVAVPLHSKYMKDAVKGFLEDSEPSLAITTALLYPRISDTGAKIIVVGAAGENSWEGLVQQSDSSPTTEWMNRDDPMLLLYTSGSTGNPKGVIHVHEGALQFYKTGQWVLDFKDNDIYWCNADPGWITGTAYGVWAPWLNGVAILVYNGTFSAEKWYSLLKKNNVTVWYTTPTYLRLLMSAGIGVAKKFNCNSLRKILSVGEPLNPIANRWSRATFNLPIHDSWWMTETGGLMIANFSCLTLKPGSMGKPVPGIRAAIINEKGDELPPFEMGQLAIKAGWPAMMRGIWKDEEKFNDYFLLPPWYLTGDLAYRDHEGYFWFQGRIDDVLKINSERVGPFEIESKLTEHPAVTEAGVIGKPDPLRGEIIKAFIVLEPGFSWSEGLKQEICSFMSQKLAPHLVPQELEVCTQLPRTRSGKLMRRVLKSWELGLPVSD